MKLAATNGDDSYISSGKTRANCQWVCCINFTTRCYWNCNLCCLASLLLTFSKQTRKSFTIQWLFQKNLAWIIIFSSPKGFTNSHCQVGLPQGTSGSGHGNAWARLQGKQSKWRTRLTTPNPALRRASSVCKLEKILMLLANHHLYRLFLWGELEGKKIYIYYLGYAWAWSEHGPCQFTNSMS